MRRRVVITGAGVVSALGVGVEPFWDALAAGRSGARRVELEGVGSVCAFPADGEEEATARFGGRETRRMDRVGRLAAVAGALALEDAGPLGIEPERMGVAVGSAHGGADTALAAHRAFLERGAERVGPLAVPLSLVNHPCAAAARALGLRGPSAAPATACAAGADAIGAALSVLREGRAEAVLAGGADAALSPMIVAGYRKAGALSASGRPAAECSRPFDAARDGFVIGEGAGLLVLEERERALRRGARVYAELAGYASTCDAGHPTDPDPTGAGPARAVRLALEDARRSAEEVGYVNAHATATRSGDVAESRAIALAGLGGAAVSATKSAHGHALGAAGGLEAAATLMAFARAVLPATLNLEEPEPETSPFDHVTAPRRADVEAAVSNSFGFGGHNACLVFTRHHGP